MVFHLRRFWNFLLRRKAPLTGAPLRRRMKNYAAQSGYVYQYFYEGQRRFSSKGESGAEFVFRVSADGKQFRAIEVRVPESAIHHWERTHGRPLSPTERYAIAKLSLFQAFDTRPAPEARWAPVNVSVTDIEATIQTLGL